MRMRRLFFLTVFAGCEPRVIVEGSSAASAEATSSPGTTEPSATESSAPSTTEPTTGLGTTEPGTTEPGTTEPGTTEPTTTEPTTTGANPKSQIEIIRGSVFASSCEGGDLLCGAQAACEAVTGKVCKQQAYDCLFGGAGTSFFPEGGPGMDAFNFGAYDVADGFGNICACDTTVYATFGIPRLYTPCGEGGWRFVP